MSPPALRRAVPADVDALTGLAAACYSPYLPRMQGVRPMPMDDDYAAAVAEHEVWVATDDDVVVGLLVLVAEPDHLLLHNVAVHPGHQGRGLGHRLLRLAEERTRELGLPVVRLYTHVTMVENQRMYERAGYTEVDRGEAEGRVRVLREAGLTASGVGDGVAHCAHG